MSRTGLVLAAIYSALATNVFLQDRAAPRTMGTGFASVFVVWPAVVTASRLGWEFGASNTSQMVWAILYCAVLCYWLGSCISKVVANLTQ